MKWKTIKNYEGLYEISDNGDIKSLKRNNGVGSRLEEKIRKQKRTWNNYCSVALSKNGKLKHFLTHRIVAEAFISNPKKFPQINHKNGIKTDNRVENLEWCDHQYNQIEARKLDLQGGEKTNTAKLTKKDIKAIRYLYPKVNSRELSEAFGIGQSTICKIINKEYWKYVKS